MKLGILTFHCAHNYGAMLQCYALQEYLKSLGHEVNVIDYRPYYLVDVYKKNSYRYWFSRTPQLMVRKFITEIRLHKVRVRRYEKFDDFLRTRFQLTPYIKGMDFHEFDAIFIGSDQVWNKGISGGDYDPVYFGENAVCPVIVYAASNKMSALTLKDELFFKQYLHKLTNISVREERLQKLLQPLTNKIIVHAVDPTLLAGTILTDRIERRRLIYEKYVLVYEIDEHAEVIQTAKEYANTYNYKVVLLSACLKTIELNIRDQEASPSDFVNYIRYAECIFTSSFHGTALSIILKKKFYSFRQHTNADYRIESLLNSAGLNDRFIEMGANIDDNEIDYLQADNNLNGSIKSSKTFIKNALASKECQQ